MANWNDFIGSTKSGSLDGVVGSLRRSPQEFRANHVVGTDLYAYVMSNSLADVFAEFSILVQNPSSGATSRLMCPFQNVDGRI
jgi:hypothetical protein